MDTNRPVLNDPLTTGLRAWCPVDCCGSLGKKVRVAYDEKGFPLGGRLNVPTYVCPRGHGWTVGHEDDARMVLSAQALQEDVIRRRNRQFIVVP